MRKTVTLLALCLPLSSAMADDGSCTDTQRQLNRENTYIITGLYLNGPIKSVVTTRNNKQDSYGSSETTITLSPCGAVTQYEQQMYYLISPDVYRKEQNKTDPDNPLHLTGTSEYKFHDKHLNSQMDITRAKNDKGQISGYTMLYKTEGDNKDEDNKEETVTARFNWENGRISSMEEVQTDGKTTDGMFYHYDSQGRLSQITRNTGRSGTRFTYTDQPWPSVSRSSVYDDENLRDVYTTRCEQWDPHGNCLLQKQYRTEHYNGYFSDDNPETALKAIQRYRYEYY